MNGMPKSRPVLIVFSILAALDVLTAGAALTDVIGEDIASLLVLLMAAVQAGLAFYVQGLVVPAGDVAAFRTLDMGVVAGPAAGATDGVPVIVEPVT